MKKDILLNAGYKYNFDRALYINRVARKAFSLEFVDDHPAEELSQLIQENGHVGAWRFYFNIPPTDGARRELERVLG